MKTVYKKSQIEELVKEAFLDFKKETKGYHSTKVITWNLIIDRELVTLQVVIEYYLKGDSAVRVRHWNVAI